MNKCTNLTNAERQELLAIEEVRQGWGLEDDCTPEELGEMIYAAKFENYMTDGPGYAGPLYLLQGGGLEAPMMIIREGGEMTVLDPSY